MPALDAEAKRELARELYWFQNEDGMWVIPPGSVARAATVI